MSVRVNGQTYYRTAEVYRSVGISRTTLFRWLQKGMLGETGYRDRRGWRLFTQEELDRLRAEVDRVTETSHLRTAKVLTQAGRFS